MNSNGEMRFARQLERWGPGTVDARGCPPDEARAYCRRLAQSHYENFTVASRLLPRSLRQHFYNVYAYCRWADDLADEVTDQGESLRLLDWWEDQLGDCYRARAAHPVFVALAETIHQFDIPQQPLSDLISAFRQDQSTSRYDTFDDLLDYCRRSANPVGRIVLHLWRCHDPVRAGLSDDVCTGLQLVNFCQDVREDYARGRVYIPQETLSRFDCSETSLGESRPTDAARQALRYEVERATEYLTRGKRLVETLPGRYRFDAALFAEGGLAALAKIRDADFDVWSRAPKLQRSDKLLVVAKSARHIRLTGRDLQSNGAAAAGGMSRELAESYRHCERITRRAARNFYWAFLLLRAEKRRSMCALYAFLREADDLVDCDRPLDERRASLAALRQAWQDCQTGHSTSPLLPALVDTVRRWQMDPRHLDDALDGIEMDLDRNRYETFDELLVYCRRVASAVGHASVAIWGFDPQGNEAADACGIAFQLTNILRDLREDAAAGRVYLPLEDLRRFNYTVEDLQRGVVDERFLALAGFQIERARQYFQRGWQVRDFVAPDARAICTAMIQTYEELLDAIEQQQHLLLERRVRIGRMRKIEICASAWWNRGNGSPRLFAQSAP